MNLSRALCLRSAMKTYLRALGWKWMHVTSNACHSIVHIFFEALTHPLSLDPAYTFCEDRHSTCRTSEVDGKPLHFSTSISTLSRRRWLNLICELGLAYCLFLRISRCSRTVKCKGHDTIVLLCLLQCSNKRCSYPTTRVSSEGWNHPLDQHQTIRSTTVVEIRLRFC